MLKIFLNNFYIQNSRIGRYINFKLITIFLAIIFIVSLLVFGNQFVLRVKESIEIGVPFQELMPIVALNMLRDIPLIVALSLFLSIIITINQLYKNSEAIVMNSIGMSYKHFCIIIQPIVIMVFAILLVFTTYVIPIAKHEKSIIESKTENASEFSFITEGEFEEFKNGEIVFFASKSNGVKEDSFQNMEEIFIFALNNNDPIIAVANEAIKFINPENNGTYLRLKNGRRYQGFPNQINKTILDFDVYDLEIVPGDIKSSAIASSSIESKKTFELIRIGGSAALSELQWRISQPVSLLILSFFGVLLGRTSPRGSKGLGLVFGLVLFIFYNNFLLIAKSSIETDSIHPAIGFLGVHLVVVIVVLFFYQLFNLNHLSYVDKIRFLKNN